MRIASFLLLFAGLAAAAFCFVGLSSESLPYQDPTATMRVAQERSIRFWQFGLGTGIAISVGAVFGIRRFPKRRHGG